MRVIGGFCNLVSAIWLLIVDIKGDHTPIEGYILFGLVILLGFAAREELND